MVSRRCGDYSIVVLVSLGGRSSAERREGGPTEATVIIITLERVVLPNLVHHD